MCVCACPYAFVSNIIAQIDICTDDCICICICVHVYVYANGICVHVYVYAYVHVYVYDVYVNANVYVYVYVYIIYVYLCICLRTEKKGRETVFFASGLVDATLMMEWGGVGCMLTFV